MAKTRTKKNPVAVVEIDEEKQTSQLLSFLILVEQTQKGKFIGSVPDLNNCQARGSNRKELRKNIRTMIEIYTEEEFDAGFGDFIEYLTNMEFIKVEIFNSKIYNPQGIETNFNFSVIIRQDVEDNVYVAEVPALKGCVTDGKTLKELYKNIATAIDLYLDSFLEDYEISEIPNYKYIDTENIEVEIV